MLPTGSPLLWWDGFPLGFALTCVIELPAYLAGFAALGWLRPTGRLRVPAVLALGLAVNLVTHPALWFVAHRLDGVAALGSAEIGVVVVEGLLMAVVTRRPALSLLLALAVNALSTGIGLVALPLLIGR